MRWHDGWTWQRKATGWPSLVSLVGRRPLPQPGSTGAGHRHVPGVGTHPLSCGSWAAQQMCGFYDWIKLWPQFRSRVFNLFWILRWRKVPFGLFIPMLCVLCTFIYFCLSDFPPTQCSVESQWTCPRLAVLRSQGSLTPFLRGPQSTISVTYHLALSLTVPFTSWYRATGA